MTRKRSVVCVCCVCVHERDSEGGRRQVRRQALWSATDARDPVSDGITI